MNSNYRHHPHQSHFPKAPPITSPLEKISHALPLYVHVVMVGLSTCWAVILAVLAHLIDGPVKASWSISTTIIHASIKHLVIRHPPHARHSLGFLKLITDFTVPSVVAGSKVSTTSIKIRGNALLRGAVRQVVGLNIHDGNSESDDTVDEEERGESVSSGEGRLVKDGETIGKRMPSCRFNPATHRSVEGEWVVHKSVKILPKDSSKVILYIHGGVAFSLDYRLCPESLFPAAIEDAVAAYCSLLGVNAVARHPLLRAGFQARMQAPKIKVFQDWDVGRKGGGLDLRPEQIVVMGDSSGGCIAMQLLLVIRELGLPMPGGAVLLSAFVDYELKSDSWRRNWDSDYLTIDQLGLRWIVRSMYGDQDLQDPDMHPVFSPAYANLRGLCPLLIQVGEGEVLTDDSIRLHENAVRDGVRSRCEIYQDMFHVFQAFPTIPSCHEAITRIGQFVSSLHPPTLTLVKSQPTRHTTSSLLSALRFRRPQQPTSSPIDIPLTTSAMTQSPLPLDPILRREIWERNESVGSDVTLFSGRSSVGSVGGGFEDVERKVSGRERKVGVKAVLVRDCGKEGFREEVVDVSRFDSRVKLDSRVGAGAVYFS
ncbi:hypothetical protein HDU97_004493 [Phlyctochytrium planicorne]|nr:hypothetical protein HDU97_004493 [Phlyctochytrium planicorne]